MNKYVELVEQAAREEEERLLAEQAKLENEVEITEDEEVVEACDEHEEELEEGRDGVEDLDKGQVALAKKKKAQGKLDDYVTYLKKNELNRFSDKGKDHYIARLIKAVG